MKEEIKYNLKLSIKAICLFEDLTGVPFSRCFNENDNILPLIYCVLYSHPENKINVTYKELLPFLSNEKILEPIAIGIKKEIDMLNQFEAHRDTSTDDAIDLSDTSTNEVQNENNDVFMKDIVPILTMDCGLDINYVMNEMKYTDVDSFIKYREKKHENELEEQRLWTFYSILPHVDTKKLKKPEDLIKFPWEKTTNAKFNEEVEEVTEKLKELGIIKENKEEL